MKAKKFLRIVKYYCNDTNCESKRCPFADDKLGCLMLAGEKIPEEWDVDELVKIAKKASKHKCIF